MEQYQYKRLAICEVCLMDANGLHFSIQSCRACAAFFRRTIVLKLSYLCQRDQNCDVTKKQRFCCRFCRFQRCIRQGMKPMMVQSGATHEQSPLDSSELSTPPLNQSISSNSPKDIMEYEDPSSNPGSLDFPSSSTFSNDVPQNDLREASKIKQVLLKKKIDKLFEHMEAITDSAIPIRLNITQQGIMAMQAHNKRWPLCTRETLRVGFALELEPYMEATFNEIEYIAMFCMALEDFAKLEKDQKWIIFRRFWHRFIPIERYLTLSKVNPNASATAFLSYDGQLFDFDEKELEAVIKRSDQGVRKLFEFLRPSCEKGINLLGSQLTKLRPSEFEIIVCLLQCLWKIREDDALCAGTRSLADQVRNRISEEVHNYYSFEMNNPRYAPRIMKLMNLVSGLDVMEQQRREDNTVFKMFDILPFDVFFTELSDP